MPSLALQDAELKGSLELQKDTPPKRRRCLSTRHGPPVALGLLIMAGIAGATTAVTAARPDVRAAYACNLPDRKNVTSWLDFGWEYLDVMHFAGRIASVQRDGAADWTSPDKCNPPAVPSEAALIAHAHAQGLKVLLAFHWNNSLGDDALFAFYNDPAAMQASASNMCARTREARCDGFSVDFEAPNVRFNATFRGLYAGYIRRVAAVASQLNLSVTTTLFMDLPTNRGIDGSAVAAAATGGTVLMTYDYHYGSSDPVAGPNAPLVGNNGSNVNHTVAWALSHGMPAANTLMGIPWYSREYPTISPAYQAATNVSKTVPDQTAKAYSLPVAQKRALTLGEGGALWDASSLTPWYKFRDPTRPWLWWEGYSDNARSLALKYDVVKAFGLQGVLIWMLNGCTQTEAPWLWSGLDAAFGKAARSP